VIGELARRRKESAYRHIYTYIYIYIHSDDHGILFETASLSKYNTIELAREQEMYVNAAFY
jgi:hypothetical protein